MISVETARRLKEFGLEWKPQVGDWYMQDGRLRLVCQGEVSTAKLARDPLWLPRLDQLLANARDRGYEIGLLPTCLAVVYQLDETEQGWLWLCKFEGENPDEAAAQALLWILGKEGMR